MRIHNNLREKNKRSRWDVKARGTDGRVFDVEIQMASRDAFRERALYYWARNYGALLTKGIAYGELRLDVDEFLAAIS